MRCVDDGRSATRTTFLSQSTRQGSGDPRRAAAFPARPHLVRQVDPPPEVRVTELRPDLDHPLALSVGRKLSPCHSGGSDRAPSLQPRGGSDRGKASAASARRSSPRSQRGQSASDAQLVMCSAFTLCCVCQPIDVRMTTHPQRSLQQREEEHTNKNEIQSCMQRWRNQK